MLCQPCHTPTDWTVVYSSVRGHTNTTRPPQKLPEHDLTPEEQKGIEYDVSNRYRWSGHYINNLFKDRLPFERYIKCVNRLVTNRHHTPCILCGNQCQNEDNYLTLRANTVNSLPDRRLYYNVCENCSDQILRDKSSHAHCHCNSACTICLKTNGYYPSESGIGCYCPKGYDEPCIACKHTIEIWMGKEAMKHGAFPWHYWCLFQTTRPPNAYDHDLYDHYWPMDNPDPYCDDPLYHRNCTCVHFYNTHYNEDYRECNDISRKEDHYYRKKSGKKRDEKKRRMRKNRKENKVSNPRKTRKQYTTDDIVYAKSIHCKPRSSYKRDTVEVSTNVTISTQRLPETTHDEYKEIPSLVFSNCSLGKTWASKVCPRNEALYIKDFPRLPIIDTCSICYDRMLIPLDGIKYSEPQVITTVCGHRFHRKCFMEWRQRSQTCPLCRKKL